MVSRPTDHRNINLRQLNLDFIKGRANGRILWQPRIDCWFRDREFDGVGLPAPYTGMSIKELYDALGCSNRIYDYNYAISKQYEDSIEFDVQMIDPVSRRETIKTPVGSIFQVVRMSKSNYGEYPEKFFVESAADLKVLIYAEERASYHFNQDIYDAVLEEWGDRGEGSFFFPRVSAQALYVEMAGIMGGIVALKRYPDVCHEYFQARHRNEKAFIEVINNSPFEWVNFGDNIHGGSMPPPFFEKWILPYYQERNALLHEAGKYTFAHWDGDTKNILKYAKETGLDGIEAITPKPQGDVTIEEIKDALGDEVDLIDGIPAVLFDEYFPVSELEATTFKLIDLFPGNLLLGISDEISSTGNIERIRLVSEIVDEQNANCQ